MLRARVFQKLLLSWFDTYGRKDLPWKINKTPYRVWVAEVMLQQTQVKTVIPYFERFTQDLPDANALAQADEEYVLYLWTGLGYYTRARCLRRAAGIIVKHYGGEVPNTLSLLMALPGIGQSTAGAILALAFNRSAPILDGNVKRVLIRLHGLLNSLKNKKTEQHLWQLASYYTPIKRVGDYTQAIMDFGALVCTPRHPNCSGCPFKCHCLAYQEAKVVTLTGERKGKALVTHKATFLILQKQYDILLCKRPSIGIWANLWSFPDIPGEPERYKIEEFCQAQLQISIQSYQEIVPFMHAFTHYRLHIFPILIQISQPISVKIMEMDKQLWYNLKSPQRIGLPKPIKSLLLILT